MQILISPASFKKEEVTTLLNGGIKNLTDNRIDIGLTSLTQLNDLQALHPEAIKAIQKKVISPQYALLWQQNPNKKIEDAINHLEARIKKLSYV